MKYLFQARLKHPALNPILYMLENKWPPRKAHQDSSSIIFIKNNSKIYKEK